jgi:hypothetical protein
MQFAYDLDGTLLDTEAAVRKAYELAGLIPPPNFFGRPVKEWLKTTPANIELHKLKNKFYMEETWKMVEPLPALEIFDRCRGVILTGASQAAARFLCEKFHIKHTKLLTGLSVQNKITWMNQEEDAGIYMDDDLTAIQAIARNTRWTILTVFK